MSHQEDTQRSPTQYAQDSKKQVREQGGDELDTDTAGQDARGQPERQRENRRKLGVNEEHETEEMQKEHRRTFP